MIITTFITNNSLPAGGLAPSILLYSVDDAGQTLVISGDPMSEIGSGFYKYIFELYDSTMNYVYLIDAGTGVTANERFKYGATQEVKLEQSQNETIASSVWDEQSSDHTNTGSFGEMLSFTKADTANIVINQSTINTLISTLLKYQRNRTRIDPTAKTLTIFDDDCMSVLQVFDLKDSTGAPSVVEVCERSPLGCPE